MAQSDTTDLNVRARALTRTTVPQSWQPFVAQIWLELDRRDDPNAPVDATVIGEIAASLDKEPRAVARAFAYLLRAQIRTPNVTVATATAPASPVDPPADRSASQ